MRKDHPFYGLFFLLFMLTWHNACYGETAFQQALKAPNPAFRPQVAWVWNAPPQLAIINEQIKWMKGMGFGGFVIVPWKGVSDTVLSESWFKGIEMALNEASAKELEVWIWDDWVFPSGFGGGLVTEDTTYRARRLHLSMDVILQPGETLSFTVPPRAVAAGSVPINKHTTPSGIWRDLSLKPGEILRYQAGNERERFFMVNWDYSSWNENAAIAGDFHTLDMLNPQATRRFLKLMYEPYASRFSSYFGKTLKGFFNDEASQAYPYPWTSEFASAFQKKKGYDIRPYLPLVIACQSNLFTQWDFNLYLNPVRRQIMDYQDVWTDLLAENYWGEIASWCASHGVLTQGPQQDMDHRLYSLALHSGHFFKNCSFSHRPSIDVIWDQVVPGKFADFPRYLGSAVRILNKERGMSESLWDTGDGRDANFMRYILEHQIIRGVSHFMMALLPYEKRGFQVNNLHNSIMEDFGSVLTGRIARMNALANTGIPGVEVALYLPMKDISLYQPLMSHPHIGNLYPPPWESTDEIAEYLAYLPCEFDYIWDEAFSRLEIINGGLRAKSGQMYRTLILPPRCTISPQIVQQLSLFRRQGGTILALEEVAKELEPLVHLFASVDDFAKYLPQKVRIETTGARLATCSRRDGNVEMITLLNEDKFAWEGIVQFSGSGRLLNVNLDDGSLIRLAEGKDLKITQRLDATELAVYLLDHSQTIAAPDHPDPAGVPLTISNGLIKTPDHRESQIKGRWLSWSELGFPGYSGWLSYTMEIDWPYQTIQARLELGNVCYAAEVLLNGMKAASVPFRPYTCYLDGLKKGANHLEIRVLNTPANEISGSRQLEEKNMEGRYPKLMTLNRRKLLSGLFGPVTLTPLHSTVKRK